MKTSERLSFLSGTLCRMAVINPVKYIKAKVCLVSLVLCLAFCLLCEVSFAEKITILYTGGTHAALYHCNCPKEPDGGLTRRMTKVGQLRQANPNSLLVDSGGFFAGGVLDDYSQGIVLDKTRNEINLEALGLMNYDALNIGDDELNLGKDYLQGAVAKSKIPFLSANLKLEGIRPFVIKKVANTTFAIIGLTNDEAKAKSEGIALEDMTAALRKAIQDAKSSKAEFILVLAYLDEGKSKKLVEEVKGINVLISGRSFSSERPYSKIGTTVILSPSWQGRRLCKIDLEVQGAKIKDFNVEQIRLSNEVPDSSLISKILPQCFADYNCVKDGLKGRCDNPGKIEAACVYEESKQIDLLVINNENFPASNQESFIQSLKSVFPGLAARFISYQSDEAKAWIKKLQAKLLPIYLLGKDAEGTSGFESLNKFLEAKDGYYYISQRLSGASFFIGRQNIPGRVDVFLSTKEKNLEAILSFLTELRLKHKDLAIDVHFMVVEDEKGFLAGGGGLAEIEESLRQVCIQRYHPDKFWDYASCRAKNKESSWWDSCAGQFGIDMEKVKKCSTSSEGVDRLRENIKLNKELEISAGPVIVANNQAVFSVKVVPAMEDFEKLFSGNKKQENR